MLKETFFALLDKITGKIPNQTTKINTASSVRQETGSILGSGFSLSDRPDIGEKCKFGRRKTHELFGRDGQAENDTNTVVSSGIHQLKQMAYEIKGRR
jgi:hypothetical protein